jgi:septal ring factor EnvC (AmiA/AmiB activator)
MAAYEAQIRNIIRDPARADQLVALTKEFQQVATDSIATIKSYRAKVAALNSNYDATREDYETLFNDQDARREAFIKKAVAIRQRMAVYTTDAEWEALKKARLRALDADLQELLS